MKRKKLKLLRQTHELTQQQMADIFGTSRVAYRKIEYGQTCPKPEVWRTFQDEFNIPDAEMWAFIEGGEL